MALTRPQDGVLCFGGGDHAPTLQALLHQARERGQRSACHAPDAAHQVFTHHAATGWRPSLVVFGAGRWQPGRALDTPPDAWDAHWQDLCLPAARIGQAAITHLLKRGGGTLVFLSHVDGVSDARPAAAAPSDSRGGFSAAHAAASAGLRALAQAMARGFGPQGVHVAHLLCDLRGAASPMAAAAIAHACWAVHAQAPSAWTHELDLRSACST